MQVLNRKITFDFKSIKFKLWLHFLLFAAVLLSVLWIFLTAFLNNFYQEMKMKETTRVAQNITAHYSDENIIEQIRDIYIANDMFIQIETQDGAIIFSPTAENSWRPAYAYYSEVEAIRGELLNGGRRSISAIITGSQSNTNTMAYAGFVKNSNDSYDILYIFSPLYPVSSTIDIMKEILVYVTIMAFVLALLVSFALSARISRPIKKMNADAKKLAKGEFGIVFEGGNYSEINSLAETLTYTSLELEKSTNMQKDLIANVSHDLRTPLTMVKSYAEMIRDLSGDIPEKRKEHLDVIIEEADRLNMLVSDMLSLSRLQSGAVVIDKKPFNFSEMLDGVLASYEIFEEQENYHFEVSYPDDLQVVADEERIVQVINNLITNAIKYCGEDRVVIINASETINGTVRFEVSDHGMGIAEDELDKIWDRYYKASTNHVRNTSGTGLGLSIVKELLILHGATYGVESEVGKGSTFWFELK